MRAAARREPRGAARRFVADAHAGGRTSSRSWPRRRSRASGCGSSSSSPSRSARRARASCRSWNSPTTCRWATAPTAPSWSCVSRTTSASPSGSPRSATPHRFSSSCSRDGYDVAAEFVRWEHAVALSGVLLGVNPFGQPNVAGREGRDRARCLPGSSTRPPPSSCTPEGVALTFAGALPRPDTTRTPRRPRRSGTRCSRLARRRLPRRARLSARRRRAAGTAYAAPCRRVSAELGIARHARAGAALPALDRAAAQGRTRTPASSCS